MTTIQVVRALIFVDPRSGKPLYEQIKSSLRDRIISGVYQSEDKLPSVRELAQTTAINPNTIQKAYRDLESEGWIYSISGKGCYVSEAPPGLLERRRDELVCQLKPILKELHSTGMSAEEARKLVSEVFERTDTP